MMTLFWFLAGLATCIGIARYNRDEALFWKLFISFTGAFVAGSIVSNTMSSEKKQDKVVMIDSMPTQVLEGTPCVFTTVTDVALSATLREKSPKPVSKDNYVNLSNNVLSKVHTSARGQPTWQMFFNDS